MEKENLAIKSKLEHALNHFFASDKGIEELTGSLSKIEKLLFIVRDISTKTDLLSLNASIEAVRAGQAGKGFAVVADEVARLAEKTQDSISEIESAVDSFKDRFEGMKTSFFKTRDLLHEMKIDSQT